MWLSLRKCNIFPLPTLEIFVIRTDKMQSATFDSLHVHTCTCTQTSQIIIHQTHYEKSYWSRGFNQFTIASEIDMINAIFAADIAFIMSSSTSAWLLSPLECFPQKQNDRTLPFCFWGWIMWKMYSKTIIEFGFCMISWIIKSLCLCYLTQPSASADNTDLGFDNSWYHAQPRPIIVYYRTPNNQFWENVMAVNLFIFGL